MKKIETSEQHRKRRREERMADIEREKEQERQRLNALTIDDMLDELFLGFTTQARCRFEELLDEYIDKRIEDRLDREFNRGQYSSY